MEKKRILFVCLGNIIRSPLGEGLFRHLVEGAGLDGKYQVDSAGTGRWHVGEPPDSRMQRVAARRGVIYSHRARQVQPEDFDRFDLILAMDRENRDDLLRMARKPEHRDKVRLLREFDPEGGRNSSVPDPYYGGSDGFEEVYEVIVRSVRGLIQELEGEPSEDSKRPRTG
jgi:protein-tyrosine phosphatase